MMLYIHVPFCASHCSYCAFYSITSSRLIEEYKNTLLKEIHYTELLHGSIKNPITSIFFGGGTPSYIAGEYIAEILEAIAKIFTLSPTIEITLEANPESITEEKAMIWYEAGVRRISMGCQSIIPETLLLLDRIHTVEDVRKGIEILRSVGFNNISIDMIWGHCNHTKERWLYELEYIVQLGIQHISAYSLTVEENTKLSRQHKLQELFPTEEELCNIYTAGVAFLEQYGFEQYEISNYAQSGYGCKHNIGYWNNTLYYGYGPSSASYNGEYRYQHASSIEQWQQSILTCIGEKKEIPYKEYIDDRTHYKEHILLGLRQKQGIHIPTLNKYSTRPFEIIHKKKIEALITSDCIEYTGEYIKATTKGFLLLDSLIEYFLNIQE